MNHPIGRPFSAEYMVRDIPSVTRALRNLPEFRRSDSAPDKEEFVWVLPQNNPHNKMVAAPVATVSLDGELLRIESHSRHVLRAMQVLVDTLVGAYLAKANQAAALSS